MKTEEALERYVRQLRADGRSRHTIAQCQRHIRLLSMWLGDTPLEKVDHEMLAVFLGTPAATKRPDGRTKKPTAMNALRSSLRTFFGYCHEAGYIPSNPARLVRRALTGPPCPRGFSPEEVTRFRRALEGAPIQHRALFLLLLRGGLRIGSALAIEPQDVDLDRCRIRLRAAKRGRVHLAHFPPELAEDLRSLMGEGPLFPVTCRHALRLFHRYLAEAGLARRGLHELRHTFAMRIYQRTRDLRLVQGALGHASIQSTTVYARAEDDEISAAVAAF